MPEQASNNAAYPMVCPQLTARIYPYLWPQWNVDRNSYISIQEKAFENIVCEMEAFCLRLNVLTWKVCVVGWHPQNQTDSHMYVEITTSLIDSN